MTILLGLIAILAVSAPMFLAMYNNNKHVDEDTVDDTIRYLYHGLRRLPFPDYVMGEEAKEMLPCLWTDPRASEAVVRDMLRHLELQDLPIEVEVQFRPDDVDEVICGLFFPAKNGKPARIQLGIKNRYTVENLLSIIAHECCHVLLYTRDIHKKDEQANEILTDIASVYCGFTDIMKVGYEGQVVTSVERDAWGREHRKKTRQEIGYISVESLEYTYQRIQEELRLVNKG